MRLDTHSVPEQFFIVASAVLLVEAKNDDMKRGYAQCIAGMVAASVSMMREGTSAGKIYGAVTIGERWKFLELEDAIVRIDAADYYIEHCAKILSILLYMSIG